MGSPGAVSEPSIASGDGMNHGRLEIPIQGWPPRSVRFLAVFHQWHVHSLGFETVELKADSRESAQQEAAHLWRLRQGFYSVDFTLVELECDERLVRRMSWVERWRKCLTFGLAVAWLAWAAAVSVKVF